MKKKNVFIKPQPVLGPVPLSMEVKVRTGTQSCVIFTPYHVSFISTKYHTQSKTVIKCIIQFFAKTIPVNIEHKVHINSFLTEPLFSFFLLHKIVFQN